MDHSQKALIIISTLNLIAFLGSVFVLWRTKQATERQSERTSKPVISLVRENWKLEEDQILEPQWNVKVAVPFRMRNVGNGTALDIHWRFLNAAKKELNHGMTPHVQPNCLQQTGLNPNQIGLSQTGGVCYFEAEYRSISGERYRVTEKIEGLRIVEFNEEKL